MQSRKSPLLALAAKVKSRSMRSLFCFVKSRIQILSPSNICVLARAGRRLTNPMNVEPKKIATPTAAAIELFRGMTSNTQNAVIRLAAGPAAKYRQKRHLSAEIEIGTAWVSPLARLCQVHSPVILPELWIVNGPIRMELRRNPTSHPPIRCPASWIRTRTIQTAAITKKVLTRRHAASSASCHQRSS